MKEFSISQRNVFEEYINKFPQEREELLRELSGILLVFEEGIEDMIKLGRPNIDTLQRYSNTSLEGMAYKVACTWYKHRDSSPIDKSDTIEGLKLALLLRHKSKKLNTHEKLGRTTEIPQGGDKS